MRLRYPCWHKAKVWKASRNDALADIVKRVCVVLQDAEAPLNALDARVEDGDTGSTIATPARHIAANLNKMPLAKPGDRTMIDALLPALDALRKNTDVIKAASAARKGANATVNMSRARAGRSTYVSADKLKGFNDPGAKAVALLLEGLSANY